MRPNLVLQPLVLAAALSLGAGSAQAALLLNEGFNGGIPATWQIFNLSDAVAGPGWFQGSGDIDHFPAQSGAANSYAATSVFVGGVDANGDPTGMVDAYLLSPTVALDRKLELSFYTRTLTGNAFGESLGVYMLIGNDFFPLVLVNDNGLSNPVAGGFPETWTRYRALFDERGAGVTGRLTFNYFIPDASTAGNYIGLDSVLLNQVPEPGGWMGAAALLAALAASRRRAG